VRCQERQRLTKEISPYIIYGWKFHFVADLDSLQMYGTAAGGTFAYICYVIDGQGRTVGQGRGVAELREPQMLNANKAVKMALKRAQADAVLRCAGLCQWFTQELEDPPTSRRVPRRRPGHQPRKGVSAPLRGRHSLFYFYHEAGPAQRTARQW
jgi:hypothetical protein